MDQRDVVLYTGRRSLRSWRAKRLLRRSGYQFEVLDTTDHPKMRTELLEATHHEVVLPYVFIDHRPVGGFGIVKTLHRSGEFERLLRNNI
jgi:glutaredoxin